MSIANTGNETIIEAGIIDGNDQVQARVEHLKELERLVGNSYPNKYERSRMTGAEDTISRLLDFKPLRQIVKQLRDNTPEGEKPNPEFKDALNAELRDFGTVRVSGRLAVPPRVMGKAAFVHLSDGKERLQIYVRKDEAKAVYNGALSVPPASAGGAASATSAPDNEQNPPADAGGTDLVDGWDVFKLLDHGDFVGASGFLFLTNTGELSVHVETFQFLSKALLPMPDKLHGIADPELRRRYRYADLIASSLQIEHEDGELTTREVFERRARLISGMRRYLDDHGYIEVETPMLTPKATGAAAKPFETKHEALKIPLYARIAPELYLKRLTVGGFEKVYELNRNFRNEGLSHKHNPEFTMLEFYCAYMDVNGMMDFAEAMIKESVQKATGGSLQVEFDGRTIDFSKFERLTMKEIVTKFADGADVTDENLIEMFEERVEDKLINPTFIVDYPKSISPLSKASPQNPQIAERFELFINGMECANGFSELNDPQEQFERFVDQMRERDAGDAEAMVLDEDYIRALAYGMPPAAGIGIGIDRLVMLLTNRHSIRDVILFPHMRPIVKEDEEKKSAEEEATENQS